LASARPSIIAACQERVTRFVALGFDRFTFV
jgi:hypothetical protein